MVAIVSTLIFAGALVLSLAVIAMAIGPQWQRVMRLAIGRTDEEFAPLSQLVLAERRIAVRRWAAQPIPAPIRRLRAAA